jgi:flagellar basal-body rod protein FlgG
MEALQTKLDVVANNLANVNTTGFKRGMANFEDLFYRHQAFPGALDSQQVPTATGTSIGLGSRVSSVQTDFGQGAFRQTNNPLNIVIEGRGFLQVQDPSTNTTVYTRAGNLSINAQGQLVIGSAATGRILQPPIQIDTSTMTNVSINDSGQVLVQQSGQAQPTNAGTLQLATFVNPEGLLKMGENLYSETTASGTATLNNPGTNGTGSIRSGMLEASNVEPVQELIDLITTQRSFELNSQAIKAGDEVLQLISNLRRG